MTGWEWRQEFFGFFLIMIMILVVLLSLAGLCLYMSRIYYIDAKKAIQARNFCLDAQTSSVAQIKAMAQIQTAQIV